MPLIGVRRTLIKPKRPSLIVPFGLSFVTSAQNLSPVGGAADMGTLSLGSADTTRQIIIAAAARFTTAAVLSSVTVGGVAATQIASASASLASTQNSALWMISVPAGTSADVTLNYSATILRAEVAIYRLVGSTATANAGNAQTSASATSLTSSGLSIPSGGAAIGVGLAGNTTNIGATNLTLDVNTALGVSAYMAGSNTTGSGAMNFTFTWVTSASLTAAFATFVP